ncbi:hypothetical protein CORC01_10067, partial [Colletotrichum orchidophilum]
ALLDVHQIRVAGARVNNNITTKPTAQSGIPTGDPVPWHAGRGRMETFVPGTACSVRADQSVEDPSRPLSSLSSVFSVTIPYYYTVSLRRRARSGCGALLPKCPCFHFRLSRPIPTYGIQAPSLEIHHR